MNNHRYCRVALYIPIAAYTKRGLVARQEMETEGLNCVQVWQFCILHLAFTCRPYTAPSMVFVGAGSPRPLGAMRNEAFRDGKPVPYEMYRLRL